MSSFTKGGYTMRVFQIMAVLAMATLLGCGGGGGDDDGELRTSIACFDA